jgi:NAD(P)-dependent dehydrogenase (short-subunit alcohol dehydrogenase family)
VSVVVVTGANSGIGRATVEGLAAAGCTVVMLCRSAERGMEAQSAIELATGNCPELVLGDLADPASVRQAADAIASSHPKVDVLINNAGGYFPRRTETADGLEMTFAVNHMGAFRLTHALEPTLQRGSRVVNLSSWSHRDGKLDWSDVQRLRRRYWGYQAYSDSKLCNILFTRELARRWDDRGVLVHAVHPGVINTGFAQDEPGFFNRLFKLGAPLLGTPESGAATSIHVATSEEAGRSTGRYWAKSRIKQPSRAAKDPSDAERLWELSVSLRG